MEVDAFLILVLSVARLGVLGSWVLAIGAFRYAARWPRPGCCPGCGGTVPPRYWRKAVAAIQGIVLTVAVADVLPDRAVAAVAAVALALLAWSFGTQGASCGGRVRLADGPTARGTPATCPARPAGVDRRRAAGPVAP